MVAALDVLEEFGLDGLTMRRVGDRLGVKSASLYWHVRNKQELLDLTADAICAEVRAPEPSPDWPAQLEAIAHEYRRVLRHHRDAATLLATTLPVGPNRLRLAELLLSSLLGAGFDPQMAARAGMLFTDYVTNFAVEQDRAGDMIAAFGDADDDGARAIQDWFAGLPPDEYPSLVRLSDYLAGGDPDVTFEFGLRTLLDGLPEPGA